MSYAYPTLTQPPRRSSAPLILGGIAFVFGAAIWYLLLVALADKAFAALPLYVGTTLAGIMYLWCGAAGLYWAFLVRRPGVALLLTLLASGLLYAAQLAALAFRGFESSPQLNWQLALTLIGPAVATELGFAIFGYRQWGLPAVAVCTALHVGARLALQWLTYWRVFRDSVDPYLLNRVYISGAVMLVEVFLGCLLFAAIAAARTTNR